MTLGYGAARAIRNATLGALLLVTPAVAEPVVIAALGDSLTQGYGLPPEDGLVPQLSEWLEAEGADVEVINAGVSGDTAAGGLSRIEWTLTPEVDALIVELGANDLLRGVFPDITQANLTGILEVARDRGVPVLLVGFDAPANYGAAFEKAYDLIWPTLEESFDILLYPDFFAAITRGRDPQTVLRDFMQRDAIHPNAKGVELVVDDLGPMVLKLIDRAAP